MRGRCFSNISIFQSVDLSAQFILALNTTKCRFLSRARWLIPELLDPRMCAGFLSRARWLINFKAAGARRSSFLSRARWLIKPNTELFGISRFLSRARWLIIVQKILNGESVFYRVRWQGLWFA